MRRLMDVVRLRWLATGVAVLALMVGAGTAAAVEPLEVESFQVGTLGADALQAGAHADVSGTMAFVESPERGTSGTFLPKGDVRDTAIDLPAGMVGNPTVVPACERNQLLAFDCPIDSQVGTVFVYTKPGLNVENGQLIPLYNLVPEDGTPAEFGFMLEGEITIATASVVPSEAPGGYGLQLTFTETPTQVIGVLGINLTMWAVPADPSHDPERMATRPVGGKVIDGRESFYEGGQESHSAVLPFLRNPTSCGGSMVFTATLDSWQLPGVQVQAPPAVSEGVLTGCDQLTFQPEIRVSPGGTQADTPAGYTVEVLVPQEQAVEHLGTPDLREATVTLPQGVSVSPASAEGLVGCTASEFGAGKVLRYGLRESVAAGECPAGSQVAKVLIETPLLAHPLEGHVYLAQPECDPCTAADVQAGRMIGLYLEAAGSGVVVKVKGAVSANPGTGQLTARFENLPQLPFSRMRMQFSPGSRASLANPQKCGQAVSSAEMLPWSWPGTPAGTPSSSFQVAGCPAGQTPFAPAFTAGTINPDGGRYSTFTVALSRRDGEQDLSGMRITTPPGISGMLSHVTLCGEPQAAQGTCSTASQIGTATVSAGSGGHPFTLSGPVYLTGAYRGQPFGLSIVVPTTAGPFTLAGNTGHGQEVVRAAIAVDPVTAALTVASDPIPQVIDGVPLRLRDVTIAIDRRQFMFNPTSCSQKQITGVLRGGQGAADHVSVPFAAGGCGELPFEPKFKALTHAYHSRNAGAYLHVVVKSGFGQANIASVKVKLPSRLPSRFETLKHSCTEAQFAADPAGCPKRSIVGVATAYTPVLPVPLRGPAIFVSHGGHAYPDLVTVLQGDGVTVDLTGHTSINGKTGVTSSTFNTVPDVPVKRFDLVLPESAHSALGATGNLCWRTVTRKVRIKRRIHGKTVRRTRKQRKRVRAKLWMPTTIRGQNGAVIKQRTHITVTGCNKHKQQQQKKHKTKSGSNPRKGR